MRWEGRKRRSFATSQFEEARPAVPRFRGGLGWRWDSWRRTKSHVLLGHSPREAGKAIGARCSVSRLRCRHQLILLLHSKASPPAAGSQGAGGRKKGGRAARGAWRNSPSAAVGRPGRKLQGRKTRPLPPFRRGDSTTEARVGVVKGKAPSFDNKNLDRWFSGPDCVSRRAQQKQARIPRSQPAPFQPMINPVAAGMAVLSGSEMRALKCSMERVGNFPEERGGLKKTLGEIVQASELS